jgi:hypothetical protein
MTEQAGTKEIKPTTVEMTISFLTACFLDPTVGLRGCMLD